MTTTTLTTPTSHLRLGLAQADITPPVGIYHPMWGAARHHRATGIHHPLSGEVLICGPLHSREVGFIRVQLDMVGLAKSQYEALAQAIATAGGVAPAQVIITFSHTHAGGYFAPDRIPLPGGELIRPYLVQLTDKLTQACRQAQETMQPCFINYAVGRCNLAANRDYWDAERDLYACGFNPDTPADDTVIVGRITSAAGQPIGNLVNYACHPTTLAWENTLISPDYVGAMREVVEMATGVPCLFLLGACGDLGPRHGFVGDPVIADRNGRQLGHAVLAALLSLEPPATDYHYQGPVVSGATLGIWEPEPLSAARRADVATFAGGTYSVDLPLKPIPDRTALEEALADWLAKQEGADAAGDAVAARNYGAYAERTRRWLGRLDFLPPGETLPFPYAVYQLGDALWVTCGGEPYNAIQVELRRRFPDKTIVFSPLAGDMQVAYLLPQDRYGQGLYQEEPSSLAAGCLERLTEAIAGRILETLS